jgi:hypothetical protein
MKIARATVAALLFTVMGSVARAEQESPPAKLYDDELAHLDGSKAARAAIEEMSKQCDFSVFSRSGPRPSQIEGCEKSVARAVAVGPSVVPDALRKLNDRTMGYGARLRTYDVLARVADVRSLEPLVLALAKTESDAHERHQILATLGRISYAKLGESTRFGSEEEPSSTTAAWRSWLVDHRGMSRDALLEERLTDARAHTGDPDSDTAFIAARFLAKRKESQREGLVALQDLLQRSNLPENAASAIRYLIQEIAPPPAKKELEPKQQKAAPNSKVRSLS